jgi:hypothetical protein
MRCLLCNGFRICQTKWTFQIPPIAELLTHHAGDGRSGIENLPEKIGRLNLPS